nr:o-succinylbenzoate--CoA ligase [Alkalibacillus aidingensis]
MISPERVAFRGDYQTWNYHQVAIVMNRMAVFFQDDMNIQKGDRVAILAHNSVSYLITYFALAKVGAIVVPLNTRLSLKEWEFQINDSGAKHLLYDHDFEQSVTELQLIHRFESVFELGQCLKDTSTLSTSTHISSKVTDPHTPFIICYTSGTTGRPKGAVLTHENMFWNAINNITAIDLTSYDRVIVLLPLFHIGGIGLFAFPTILAGGAVVVPGKFNPDQAIHVIEQEKITVVMGVPAIHEALLNSSKFKQADFSHVRWFYNGGAPISQDVIKRFLSKGIPFGQGFGMSETSPTIFMLTKEDYERKIGSIGKPALFNDVKILDDHKREVNQGETGELHIKGPNVMDAYWGLPEETKNTFYEGWLASGDLVRQDEEGFYWVAGRKKDMIISGGENVYPLEVEQVIDLLDEIEEVAVVGHPDETWGEVPVAYIKLIQGEKIDRSQLISECQKYLGKYKIPKRFYEVSELPRNATGKVLKSKLVDQIYQEKEID